MALKKYQFLNIEAGVGAVSVQANLFMRNVPNKLIALKRVLVQSNVFLSSGQSLMAPTCNININNSDGVNPADLRLYRPPVQPDLTVGIDDPTLTYFFGDNPKWLDVDVPLIGGQTYNFSAAGYFPALTSGDFGYVFATLEFEVE